MHLHAQPRRHCTLPSWARVGYPTLSRLGQPCLVPARRRLHCIRALDVPEAATGQPAAPAAQQQAQSARLPPELQSERFEVLFSQLLEWRDRYYDCNVPRQAYDAQELGEWVHRLRRLRAQGLVPEELVSRLSRVGFAWTLDNISAKWYHNLHVARRYKALHGTAEIPPDYSDPSEPNFVEAGRWLARQRDLYKRQKLLRVRVRQMKEALGIKFDREYAPVRRNLHPVIRREDAKFEKELQRRARQAQQALEGQQEQQGQRGQKQGAEGEQGPGVGGRGGSERPPRALRQEPRRAGAGGHRERPQQQGQVDVAQEEAGGNGEDDSWRL